MVAHTAHIRRPPRVLVTSDDRQWDLSALSRWGEVYRVPGNYGIFPDNVDERMPQLNVIARRLSQVFFPECDHVALVGDPLAAATIVAHLFSVHLRLSILKFDRQAKGYYQSWIQVTPFSATVPHIGVMEHGQGKHKSPPEASGGGFEARAFFGGSDKVTSP